MSRLQSLMLIEAKEGSWLRFGSVDRALKSLKSERVVPDELAYRGWEVGLVHVSAHLFFFFFLAFTTKILSTILYDAKAKDMQTINLNPSW